MITPLNDEGTAKPKEDKPKSKYVVRTAMDQQRIKVEKLMQNPVIFIIYYLFQNIFHF